MGPTTGRSGAGGRLIDSAGVLYTEGGSGGDWSPTHFKRRRQPKCEVPGRSGGWVGWLSCVVVGRFVGCGSGWCDQLNEGVDVWVG